MSGASRDDNRDGMEIDACVAGVENSGLEGDRSCVDGETTPVLGVKRKGVPSSPPLLVEDNESRIEAGLAYIRSTLKSAMTEVRTGGARSGSDGLIKSLENIYDTVSQMLTKKGKLKSSLYPVSKKVRSGVEVSPASRGIGRPEMVDVGTDTLLTPYWWESEQECREEESSGCRAREAVTSEPQASAAHTCPRAESAMETNPEGWQVADHSRKTRKPPGGIVVHHPVPPKTRTNQRTKPPAVLVKVAAGSSYADTVRAVRQNSDLNLAEMGAQVTGMRRTRDGHLLVELAKGAGSVEAAHKLSSAIATRLGEVVGAVSHLGQYVVVEIVDLDAVATEGEVLAALRTAIPGAEDDQAAIYDRQAVQVTGLWSTRAGQQIATARMTRASASAVTRIPVGWTMCRVRPRRPDPEKCFRCHGFGHRSSKCSGPDLSLNCRRCGEPGHEQKQCEADKDRCVACERAGFVRFTHEPGSGACKARREALKPVLSSGVISSHLQ